MTTRLMAVGAVAVVLVATIAYVLLPGGVAPVAVGLLIMLAGIWSSRPRWEAATSVLAGGLFMLGGFIDLANPADEGLGTTIAIVCYLPAAALLWSRSLLHRIRDRGDHA